jgi:putative permease
VIDVIRNWFKRHFSDPQAIMLVLTLVVVFTIVITMGGMLAPVIASLVIAYLLEGTVRRLEHWHFHRLAAVTLVFTGFMFFVGIVLFIGMPLLYNQSAGLVSELPLMISQAQDALLKLPQKYPDIFTEEQIVEMMGSIREEVATFGKSILTWSLSSVVGLIAVIIYLILVPLLVFFFLKDKSNIISWFNNYIPQSRDLAQQVWNDVDRQLGNYVRGKFIEIIIIWAVCIVTFTWFGLNFAMLLAVLVGLSVIVPYIGAAVVTLPVAIVAYFQWGLTADFYWLMIAYFIIQALDGNALVPLLFSEVVNLHPIAIIVAILVFGGLWGFWGVFFAIPLATLVQAILEAWPKGHESAAEAEA